MKLENQLREALFAGARQIEASTDLFDRVQGGIEDDRRRRSWRAKVFRVSAVTAAALALVLVLVTDYRNGELIMAWWFLEIITIAVLIGIVIVLGPFIKRFGRSYAAEVFRSNPGTGKSFIVLTDFAYYLIFGSYVLFTPVFSLPEDWTATVGAAQLQFSTGRIAGIFLIMGVLHGVNLLMLPIIGRLLTLNRQLDLEMHKIEEREGRKK